MTQEALESKSKELQAKHDELLNQLLELKKERIELKKSQKEILKAGMSCSCDDNYCDTVVTDKVINEAETNIYCHDDQDRGNVNIICKVGEIKVVIYRAVWSTFEEYATKTLIAGQSWNVNIDSASSIFDQTNRVDVIGIAESSTYNMDFKSWDD